MLIHVRVVHNGFGLLACLFQFLKSLKKNDGETCRDTKIRNTYSPPLSPFCFDDFLDRTSVDVLHSSLIIVHLLLQKESTSDNRSLIPIMQRGIVPYDGSVNVVSYPLFSPLPISTLSTLWMQPREQAPVLHENMIILPW